MLDSRTCNLLLRSCKQDRLRGSGLRLLRAVDIGMSQQAALSKRVASPANCEDDFITCMDMVDVIKGNLLR